MITQKLQIVIFVSLPLAWREMAKQVAHEIKNPLTPMRLSIQTFERGFSKGQEYSKQRIKEFSDSLIHA